MEQAVEAVEAVGAVAAVGAVKAAGVVAAAMAGGKGRLQLPQVGGASAGITVSRSMTLLTATQTASIATGGSVMCYVFPTAGKSTPFRLMKR